MNISVTNEEKFADVVAVLYCESAQKLITLYSDKTFFIWELDKVERMDKIHVIRHDIYHAGSIYDMDLLHGKDNILKIVTCSDDRSIRYWNLKMEEFIPNSKCIYLIKLL